jgi:putative hydrolase of the HAD superfamily
MSGSEPARQASAARARWPRAITLDLDDTLWPMLPVLKHAERTLASWLVAHAPATAAFLDPDTRVALREAVMADHPERAHDVGFLRLELLRRALARAGDDPSLAQPAFDVFFEARQQVSLFDDVLPVLERWSTKVPVVALTNGNADLHRIGLARFFKGVVSAHELGCAKPDPRAFHAACELAGASLLIFAHKQDLEGALSTGEIAEALGLGGDAFAKRHWAIHACSAVTGAGLIDGWHWLVGDFSSRIFLAE